MSSKLDSEWVMVQKKQKKERVKRYNTLAICESEACEDYKDKPGYPMKFIKVVNNTQIKVECRYCEHQQIIEKKKYN